jgi:uncharacterized protein (DUF58 family)
MTGGNRARATLDWGKLSTLRLRAEAVADGVFGGAHRSRRKGSGVEFGGHRSYVPGDDLRFLDRRAMMRHGRLLVREFETETDRGVRLLVDASPSMGYRSEGAPVDKLAFAAVLAAALTRITVSGSDTVSLDWLGGTDLRPLPPLGGMHAFERLVETLDSARPGNDGDLSLDQVVHAARSLERRARRGTVVVILSDFLDLPEGAVTPMAHLASRGRVLIAVRLLDPAELTFPFEGPVHFHAAEGNRRVETDGRAARAGFLAALREQTAALRGEVVSRGGRLVEAATTEDPVSVLQRVLAAAARSQT